MTPHMAGFESGVAEPLEANSAFIFRVHGVVNVHVFVVHFGELKEFATDVTRDVVSLSIVNIIYVSLQVRLSNLLSTNVTAHFTSTCLVMG